MPTLGEILRDAREGRDISLPQAERETRIRQKYITAFEDDNLVDLPGPVYARGFLRNYAAYLGVDVNNALELFDEQVQPTRDKIKTARGKPSAKPVGAEKISIQPLSPEPIDTRVRYGSSYIAVSLLALPLIIAFYFIYSAYAGRSRDVPIPTTVPRPATVTPLPSMTVLVQAPVDPNLATAVVPTPSGEISAGQTLTGTAIALQPTLPAVAAESVTVKVVTSRDAWMRVLVDNVQVYSGTLPRGATRQWAGKNIVRIRTGRADSVQVTVNGADRGLMGTRSNLIVEKEWDRSGEERIIQR